MRLSPPVARWTREPARPLVALLLFAGVVSIVVVLHYGGYPHEPYRYLVFGYLLRTQDLAGTLLLMALAVAAWFAPGPHRALAFVDAVSRHPWLTAGIAFAMLCAGTLYVAHDHPLAQDEYAALFQSRAFAAGRLTGQFPPDLVGRLVPPAYFNHFIYASPETGQVASAYWPGFALLLAPFSALQAHWACNPLLAAAALLLIGALAERLAGAREARGWAMLLALASPGFTAMAISYFSMTAHLLANLLFVWLLLERTTARLVLAGAVGSLALLLHNPYPHFLFALPWIVWLALQPAALRNLGALAAGYLPLAVLGGFGWALLLSGLQGKTEYALFAADDDPLHRVANFFWAWHVKLRSALPGPGDEVLTTRIAELVRLWCWAVPGLPVLAAAGWWLARRDAAAWLLGLSAAATLIGYLFIGFPQGHGWGARYYHSAWGALPILAAVALTRAQANPPWQRLAGYVASLAILSLVFATALRTAQIHGYIAMHLENRPPVLPAARQIVFVRFDRANYTADLVQNDPFLRNRVWFLLSFGPSADERLMRARFPGARLVAEDWRGSTWRLD